MKAVVLAGGLGTRLRPLTYTRPKPMLPIADKPILYYILTSLRDQGFREVIITTNYMDHVIREYFGDGSKIGVKLVYTREKTPLGTAGGVLNAQQYLDETFAVIQGDNVTEINLADEMKYHRRKRGVVTIAVKKVPDPWRFGVVKLNRSNRIVKFFEKPKPEECFSKTISTGLYVCEPEIFDYIPPKTPYDFARDLFPDLLSRGKPMYGYRTDAFWVDVGSLDGYVAATLWVLKRLRNYVAENSEVEGKVAGPVWIGENVRVERDAKIIGPALIEDDVVVKKEAVVTPGAVIKNGVTVGKSSKLNGSIVYENTELGDSSRLRKCVVAENCTIGQKASIGDYVIIGANCVVGEYAKIKKNARIWPSIRINPRSVVSGIIRKVRR